MEYAPGKGILKVVGILLIIFGGLGILLSLLGFLGGGIIALGINELAGGIVAFVSIVLLIVSAFDLIAGILSVINCGRPEKAQTLFVLAIILIVIQALGTILGGFEWGAIVGLALPVLLLIGAMQNKNAL